MKNPFQKLLLGLLASFIGLNANAQTPPKLKMTRVSATAAQISWTNQVGKSYRLQSTPSLAPAVWKPLEDAFSPDTNISVSIATTEKPTAFFRVLIPTNGTLPAVQIFSPTNNQIVSGEIAVRIGAQITNQLQGVNLYLDDALIGYLNSGGIQFGLETSHFANGTHTLYAGAVDTANNEILCSVLTLDFENSVRWLDACSMFNSFVPIDVDSDIFPADWLVSVTDKTGIIVRTITGSTLDGIIQTSWDGTDDNGQPLPVENLYEITVDVNEASNSSMMMASSLASTVNAASVLTTMNPHGVPEFVVQKSAPNPLTAYEENVKFYKQLTPKEKLIYPPLPTKPANNPSATTTTKMSAREMYLALHKTTGISSSTALNSPAPNSAAPSRHGSTKTLAWWEDSWSSGKTVLAYAGDLGLIQGGYVSSAMVGIRNLINTINDDIGGNRNVYQNTIYSVSSAGDFSSLTNHLAELSPNNVRSFYFYGHGNATGNAIGTLTTGIFARNVAAVLGNTYTNPATGLPVLMTHHAYSFVFLDGCNTGLGDFPEAFGIPKTVSAANFVATGHKRAFMGWGAKVTHSILSNYPLEWSSKFWQAWLDNGNDSTVLLKKAVDDAETYHPGVTNDFKLQIYGNKDLTWGE